MEKIILNGSYEAKKIFNSLKSKSSLVAILIGTDPASQIYVNIKEKKAKEIGVKFTKYILPATVSEKKVINLMNKLNKDKKIKGILVQLPLPKNLMLKKLLRQ
ncbi:MAG: tetrahydrofolate dehydrogenase/cyclohydrolase catalytic domain-containing protein [Patescibacteria group bacterium]